MINNYTISLIPSSIESLQLIYSGARNAITSKVASLYPAERVQYVTDRVKGLSNRVTTSLSNAYNRTREVTTAVANRVQIETNALVECITPPEAAVEEPPGVAPAADAPEVRSNGIGKAMLYVLVGVLAFIGFLVFLIAGLDTALAAKKAITDYLDSHLTLTNSFFPSNSDQ